MSGGPGICCRHHCVPVLVPDGVDSTQPQIRQRLSHANNAGPQASTVFATFSIAEALGTGRGGVHVGCLGSMASYSYIGECSVSKNSKKVQKEQRKLLFLR